jgi:hypothetical protein
MNITKLKQRPVVFHRIFGLSPEKFDELVVLVEPLWRKAEKKRLRRHDRKVKPGAGRPYMLNIEEQVAMLLLYTRSYTTHMFLAALFDVHDSRVCRYFARVRPVVEQVFDIPTEKTDLREDEILKLIVDATEQRTERRSRGSGYSGKKKAQTIKTQIVADKKGAIRHVSQSAPGNVHDKKLFDQSGIKLPDNAKGDLGYTGTNLTIPHKSSKLHSLTKTQIRFNERHSRRRIIVEHVFARLKSYRILADRFRGHLNNYHEYFMIVAGLCNFARS